MRRRLAAAAVLTAAGAWVTGAWLAGAALGAPSIGLHASLTPKIPGQATTVRLQMRVAPAAGELVPPPLTQVRLLYPQGLDVTLSGLGIQACPRSTLTLHGPGGCPPDSRMGYGDAIAEVPIEGEAVRETARIAILRGAEVEGHVSMLIVVYHEPAVSAQIVLPTLLMPADGPFGGRLDINAPLVSTFPEGPDLSVTRIDLVLGPSSLIYSERSHGRIVHYRPRGIPLPERCPRGGFRFEAQMSFLDGSRAAADATVRCPRRRKAGRRVRVPRAHPARHLRRHFAATPLPSALNHDQE